MRNSLSSRLTYRIMAVVLVMMVIIAGVVYFSVREYMLEEAKERYTIAAIAEESGFTNIRMLQRRIQDAIGMSPVEYRLMITRDF